MAKRNPYFRFQQFTVYHDLCAMKVGTDGTILGAWVDVSNATRALDIGTGSGLIALMMAQKNQLLKIEAIDIEKNAIEQAKINFANSPFGQRLSPQLTALKDYKSTFKFDVIASNPPYFTESLKSPNKERATARHADSLSAEELVDFAAHNLSEKGALSVIYPIEYKNKIIDIAANRGLTPKRITTLQPTVESKPIRVLIELSKDENQPIENSLAIEIQRHIYSDDFKELVKNFYLKEFIS